MPNNELKTSLQLILDGSAYRKPKKIPKLRILSSKDLKKRKYNLFLDDSRQMERVTWMAMPTDNPWRVARNYEQFIGLISLFGLPEFISFDHDLADEHYRHGALSRFTEFDYEKVQEKTGLCCAKWLVEYCLDHNKELPLWQSHTMNPCGQANIDGLLKRFKQFQQERTEELQKEFARKIVLFSGA